MLPGTSIATSNLFRLLMQLSVAALYFLLGHVIHQNFTVHSIVSVFWPGSGMALAALLIGGRRYVWGVLAGSLALNAYANSSLWAICGITLANVTEALVGYWLLERFTPSASSLRSLPGYLKLIALGGAVASIAGAVIGALSILLSGYIQPTDLVENIIHWWMGDTLGIVLLTPFILASYHGRLIPVEKDPSLERPVLVIITFIVGQIIFLDWFNTRISGIPLDYLMFLCVSWVAIRMGAHGTTFVILMTAIQALFGAYLKVGVFAHDIRDTSLHNYWFYMLTLSIVGMTLTTYVNAIKRAFDAMRVKDSALNATANGIIITDVNGRIEWFNQSFSRLTGYSQNEILGHNPSALVKSDKQASSFYRDMWETILANKVWHGEIINRKKDGSLYNEEMTITPIINNFGKIVNFVAVKQDISERKAAAIALARSEEQARLAISASNTAIWDYDIAANKVHLSEGWSRFLGGESYKTTSSIEELIQLVPEDEREMVQSKYVEAIKGYNNSKYQVTHRVKKSDGDYIWIISTGSVTERGQNGHAIRMLGTHRNITQQKLAEDTLRENEQKLRGLYELSPLGIALTDMNGRYIEFNAAFQKICGYSKVEINALDQWKLTPEIYMEEENRQLEALQKTGYYGPYEKQYIRKDGRLVPIQLNGMLVTGKDKQKYIWSIVEDISERKQMEAKVHQLAFYDTLTKLPNRRLMEDRLRQIMSASKRSGRYAALMLLDMDNFKPLNDKHGHAAGDLLLVEVANRLKSCVREVDTVSRFGGDEFIVMLSELDEDMEKSSAQAGIIAEKILSALSQTYFVSVFKDTNAEKIVEHHCTSSIGVTLFLGHNHSQQEILRQADLAMYRAKESGRNQIHFY